MNKLQGIDIISEFDLIKAKKSKLPLSKRKLVIQEYINIINHNTNIQELEQKGLSKMFWTPMPVNTGF